MKGVGKMQLILVLSAVVLCSTQGLIPTQRTVNSAKSDIEDLIRNNRDGPQFPFIGGFVRLSFHDCVGNGHCDGCINRDLDDNAGLPRYIDALEPVFTPFASLMSRADFYALAGVTASEFAAKLAGNRFTGFRQFKVGRANCSASPLEDDLAEVFPETEFTLAQSHEFLDKQFGFSIQETIAILGAHTLGRARSENSGYEGKWVNAEASESQLNNQYYKEIMKRRWEQATVADTDETQWQSNGPNFPANTPDDRPEAFMMLNADIALAFDIHPDGDGHVDSCSICKDGEGEKLKAECCEKHPHSEIVQQYADDSKAFLRDYTKAFLKMIHHNNNALEKPTRNKRHRGRHTGRRGGKPRHGGKPGHGGKPRRGRKPRQPRS